MDTYVILAGGYWQASRKQDMGGYQVDMGKKEHQTADYIIKLEGMPENYFQPMEVKRRTKRKCITCDRYVTAKEYEMKEGCITRKDHEIEETWEDIQIWETGVFDKYSNPKIKWLNPCYRIFLNNSKGIAKWRDMWRYIVGTYPPTERLVPDLLPVAVGDKSQWTVMPDEVPVINLKKKSVKDIIVDTKVEDKPEPVIVPKVEMVKCEICQKEVKKSGLPAHRYQAHMKQKKE